MQKLFAALKIIMPETQHAANHCISQQHQRQGCKALSFQPKLTFAKTRR